MTDLSQHCAACEQDANGIEIHEHTCTPPLKSCGNKGQCRCDDDRIEWESRQQAQVTCQCKWSGPASIFPDHQRVYGVEGHREQTHPESRQQARRDFMVKHKGAYEALANATGHESHFEACPGCGDPRTTGHACEQLDRWHSLSRQPDTGRESSERPAIAPDTFGAVAAYDETYPVRIVVQDHELPGGLRFKLTDTSARILHHELGAILDA